MQDLNSTYGALFIGLLASAVLFGVTMLQTFVYFTQYPADRAWRKLAVCWLWFLDALHLALCAHFVYYYLVVNYDDPSALLHMVWSFKVRAVTDVLVVVSVHTLYTLRLWTLLAIDKHVKPFGKEDRRWSDQKLTKSACASRWLMCRLVPWFVSALVVIGYGISIVMCYETFRLDSFDRLSHAPWATYVPFCFSTVIDTVIAGSLCYFLSRCRTESGAMNGPIRTLMVYTLNTGIISSVCSLIAISMMVAYPNTFISVAIEFLVIKLYINSYLAMVNARGGFRTESGSRGARITGGYTPNTSIALRDVVHVEVGVEVEVDGEVDHKPKPIPFLTYSHSRSRSHSSDSALQPAGARLECARKSAESAAHGRDIVVNLSPRSEPYPLRAPRVTGSHPDVCEESRVRERDVQLQTPTQVPAERERELPPVPAGVEHPEHPATITPLHIQVPDREPAGLGSAFSDDEEDADEDADQDGSPPLSPSSSASATSPASPLPPLTPSRASPYPFRFSHPMSTPFAAPHARSQTHSYSHPHPHPHYLSSSPPSRSLSPLRFASSVDAHGEDDIEIQAGLAHGDDSDTDTLRAPFPTAAKGPTPMPMPMYALGRERDGEVQRDRYTRMVRSARAKGKARRALFDERGVALMWGLPRGPGEDAVVEVEVV